MKHPSNQAKLLFLGLLRTATALATDAAGKGVTSQTALYSAAAAATMPRMVPPPHGLNPHHHKYKPNNIPCATTTNINTTPVQLRLARLSDVPSVSDCNLQTLPENYNHVFYQHHIQEWPDLALVAVVENENRNHQRLGDPRQYWHGGGYTVGDPRGNQDCTVVAYLLGKIQERPKESDDGGGLAVARNIIPTGRPIRNYAVERYGHVSSLAVLPDYRRQGLAQLLLQQFHHHLVPQQCTFAGLHVRQSNQAAVRLYQRQGYVPALTIKAYYEDGEDAYYMRKELPAAPSQLGPSADPGAASQSQSFLESLTARLRPPPAPVWETGPVELRLPRTVTVQAVSEETNTELLTGTL